MGAAAAALALATPTLAWSGTSARPRSLALVNLHTEESLSTVYWADGQYLPQALAEIGKLLRDHRADEVADMDVRLLDLLFELRRRLRTESPLHIISGYRAPATNEMLRRAGRGVAQNSLHREGQAADIRVPGRRLAQVHRVALEMGRGGVGFYPRSDFVHLDVGRVRSWQG